MQPVSVANLDLVLCCSARCRQYNEQSKLINPVGVASCLLNGNRRGKVGRDSGRDSGAPQRPWTTTMPAGFSAVVLLRVESMVGEQEYRSLEGANRFVEGRCVEKVFPLLHLVQWVDLHVLL